MKKEKEDIREEQRNLFQATREYKKEKRRMVLTILGVLVVFVGVVKIFFGTIEINWLFPYPTNRGRAFDVTVNGEQVKSACRINKRITIIPYLIYFNNKSSSYSTKFSENQKGQYEEKTDKYIMNVKSYSCHSKRTGVQFECTHEDRELREKDDTEYIGLKIQNVNSDIIIYEGEFINDISEYIKNEGEYRVVITVRYEKLLTDVSFNIKK